MKNIYVEGRRRLSPLVYVNGILPLNTVAVIAVRHFFFKGYANGCGKQFYDEELPAPTFCCFLCGVLFKNTFNLAVEI